MSASEAGIEPARYRSVLRMPWLAVSQPFGLGSGGSMSARRRKHGGHPSLACSARQRYRTSFPSTAGVVSIATTPASGSHELLCLRYDASFSGTSSAGVKVKGLRSFTGGATPCASRMLVPQALDVWIISGSGSASRDPPRFLSWRIRQALKKPRKRPRNPRGHHNSVTRTDLRVSGVMGGGMQTWSCGYLELS